MKKNEKKQSHKKVKTSAHKSHVKTRNSRPLKSHTSKSLPKTRKKTLAKTDIAKFWCMGCQTFSKSPVDKYERSGEGKALFAKGRCSRCDTKMSVIVKDTGSKMK